MAVRSFDIFDTLLARRVASPEDVFDVVELRTGWHGFRAARTSCSAPTFRLIYDALQSRTGCTDEQRATLESAELQAEADAVYLIRANAALVRAGDVLVSDMYLPSDVITSLLRQAGLDVPITVTVTPLGKANGTVWPQLKQRFPKIEWHLGDNAHSDVRSPAAHGIEGRLTTLHAPTLIETCLAAQGSPWAAQAMREFRLSAAPLERTAAEAFALQTEHHFPLLLHACAAIAQVCADEHRSTVFLCARDGCLLEHVLPALYPHLSVVRLHTSRFVARSSGSVFSVFSEYVRTEFAARGGVDACLVFDVVSGTVSTLRALRRIFPSATPRMHVYVADAPPHDLPGLSWTFQRGAVALEFYNLDVVGTLIRMEKAADGSFRDVRAPVGRANLDFAPHYRAAARAFAAFVANPAPSWWRGCSAVRDALCAPRLPAVDHPVWSAILSHVLGHIVGTRFRPLQDYTPLTQLANTFDSDKGTEHRCAHGYTEAYELVLPPATAHPHGVALLEIGLHQDTDASKPRDVPSLRMWEAYYGGALRVLVGMDIVPELAAFHEPARNVHVVIGDQSEPADLSRAAAVAGPLGYDVIIDDGLHASRHQQISLRCLWKAVAPGGIYVIEDLHYQPPTGAPPSRVPTTKELLRAWARGELAESPHIPLADAASIMLDVEAITFFSSQSKAAWPAEALRDAMVVIRKRSTRTP